MRYTVEIWYNDDYWFQHWSDLIELPVTKIMSFNSWEKYYIKNYGKIEFNKWLNNYKNNIKLKEVLNKYKKYKDINKIDYINKYLKVKDKDIFTLYPDKLKGEFTYNDIPYRIMVTSYHYGIKKYFIICMDLSDTDILKFKAFLYEDLIDLIL